MFVRAHRPRSVASPLDSGPYRFSLRPVAEVPKLAEHWRTLEARAEPSFFLSWGWIGTWLEALAATRASAPLALVVTCGEAVVGLGILVPARPRRHLVIAPRTLALNATGSVALDGIAIEHNGFLVDPEHARALPGAIVAALERMTGEWSELLLDGVGDAYAALPLGPGLISRVRACQRSYSLALDDDRRPFGRSTRYHIRRAMRDYGALGEIGIAAAGTTDEAAHFLAELKRLHQDYWRRRGGSGAFSTGFFENFHRALIARRLAAGEIQLLRVAAGTRAVGYLYNFVYRSRVYNYQSGFDYDLLPKGQPGLLCHVQAIDYNRNRGVASYDFLAGDNQLKQTLSNREERMFWLVIRRDSLMLGLEERLRVLKQRWRR